MENFTRSQSTSKDSKSAIYAELRQQRLQPETWNPSGLQENVFANPRSTLESLQILYQGTHPFMTSSAAGQAPALISTGRLVARENERVHNSNADICKKAADYELLCS